MNAAHVWRALGAALLCGVLALFAAGAQAQIAAPEVLKNQEALQVTDPFLELHTGPGRGYPVFHVVERGEWVVVELRKTDWYRVRAPRGQTGWVQRSQLANTLTAAGAGKTFRELLLDDFRKRRVEFGAGYGRFTGEPALKIWVQAKLAETLGVELTTGQVQGVFSGTEYWHLSLSSEPWSDQRWSPFFSVGVGKFRNVPNTSLVDARPVNANLAQATIGIRYHLGERFLARLDWTLHTAFVADQRSVEYRSLHAGLGFFF